jgi:hypothetical protein
MVLIRKIEQVIEKGGHVSADNTVEDEEWTNFTLRIKKRIIRDVEEAVNSIEGISKTGFITQAIVEKLRKQNDNI